VIARSIQIRNGFYSASPYNGISGHFTVGSCNKKRDRNKFEQILGERTERSSRCSGKIKGEACFSEKCSGDSSSCKLSIVKADSYLHFPIAWFYDMFMKQASSIFLMSWFYLNREVRNVQKFDKKMIGLKNQALILNVIFNLRGKNSSLNFGNFNLLFQSKKHFQLKTHTCIKMTLSYLNDSNSLSESLRRRAHFTCSFHHAWPRMLQNFCATFLLFIPQYVSEVRSYVNPPSGVLEVMQATFLLLGFPESNLKVG